MRELAVDFGTSNTVAALRTGPQAAPRLLAVDGWPVLPSAVWLAPDGTLVVGRDAERQARLDPARFEPNPKRRIDEVEVLLGDTVIGVVDLIAAVLRHALQEAHRQLGGAPDRLVLTHPAGWGAIRCSTLAAAARRGGATGTVQLLPEPVAAAAHFAGLPGQALVVSQTLAVFDFGGGTTDTAVVTRTAQGWQVLAEAGLPDVGGRDLDQLLLEHVGRQVNTGGPEQQEPWLALLRPADAASRRAARALADDTRAAKEALSRYPQADVPLPPPLPDVHVTRAELEELARPLLERAAALMSSTISVAGLRPGDLAGLYLVGGASRMPLVARVLSDRLGVLPVAVESPESSVVLGALAVPPQREITDPHTVGGVMPPKPAGPPLPPPPYLPARPADGRHAGRRRRALLAALAVLGAVALGGAAWAASSLGDGNNPTGANSTTPGTPTSGEETTTASLPTDLSLPGGDPQPPPAQEVPLEQRNAAFGSDAELREFAGPAVDRALNCADPRGSAKEIFGLRSQVQCVYKLGDRPYYATFMSSDSDQSCDQLTQGLALTGTDRTDGEWSGGGRQGNLTEITVTTTSATLDVLYYDDSGGKLCGLVEGEDDDPLPGSDLRAQWDTLIRPGT